MKLTKIAVFAIPARNTDARTIYAASLSGALRRAAYIRPLLLRKRPKQLLKSYLSDTLPAETEPCRL